MAATKININSYIHPLYYIAMVLALVPPPFKQTRKSYCSVAYKLYVIVVTISLFSWNSFSVYGRYRMVYPEINLTMASIDLASSVLRNLSTCTVIIRSSIFNTKKFHSFEILLINSDDNQKLLLKNLKQYHALTKLILINIFLIIYISYISYGIIKGNSLSRSVFYFYKYAECYYNIITVLLICNLVTVLRMRFQHFHKQLENISRNVLEKPLKTTGEISVQDTLSSKDNLLRNLQDIRKYHCQLSELIKNFNGIYGYHIFFLIISVSSAFLEAVNYGITIIMVKELPDTVKTSPIVFDVVAKIFTGLWCSLFLVSVFLLEVNYTNV